jgi:putative ABC transport system ATP-binding protein/lipoprotein-releasing system ATP-binding protein
MARALMGEPRLILADEPTGQLDRASAWQLIDVLLLRAEETEAAVVVATHDATVAGRLAQSWTMTEQILRTGAPCTH